MFTQLFLSSDVLIFTRKIMGNDRAYWRTSQLRTAILNRQMKLDSSGVETAQSEKWLAMVSTTDFGSRLEEDFLFITTFRPALRPNQPPSYLVCTDQPASFLLSVYSPTSILLPTQCVQPNHPPSYPVCTAQPASFQPTVYSPTSLLSTQCVQPNQPPSYPVCTAQPASFLPSAYRGNFHQKSRDRSASLIIHLYLDLRLRIRGALSPFPIWLSMRWYLVMGAVAFSWWKTWLIVHRNIPIKQIKVL
jgi:hypothetical protein